METIVGSKVLAVQGTARYSTVAQIPSLHCRVPECLQCSELNRPVVGRTARDGPFRVAPQAGTLCWGGSGIPPLSFFSSLPVALDVWDRVCAEVQLALLLLTEPGGQFEVVTTMPPIHPDGNGEFTSLTCQSDANLQVPHR